MLEDKLLVWKFNHGDIEALEQLPYEQREVLILHVYGRMKFRAIARQQDVSINTVQGRYRYALEKMRSVLNGEVEKWDRRKKLIS